MGNTVKSIGAIFGGILAILLAVLILVCALAARMWARVRDDREQALELYCREINKQIRDEDFYTARVSDGGITLKDLDGTVVGEIPFEGYDEKTNRQLVYIRKDKALMYFITGGSVDDEWGILLVNGGSAGIMQGINRLERYGVLPGTYWFDTMAS